MTLISLGDMAHRLIQRQQSTSLKQQAQAAGNEVTTGVTNDIARHLRGDLTGIAGIATSLTRLEAYRMATVEAGLAATAMQGALASIESLTKDVGVHLVTAGTIGETGGIGATAQDTAQRFDAVLNVLNTRNGSRSVFAGDASDRPAVPDADTILTALESAVTTAGAVSAKDIANSVADWFADPAGFATIGYLGGAAAGRMPVSADAGVDLSITAEDPALRDTIEALALASLVARGNVTANLDVKAELAITSGEALLESHNARTNLAGRVGTVEARIAEAASRNEAERSAMMLAQSDLIAVDPYEAATRLEATQGHLESLYAVTARLSRLSLLDFLR